MCIVYHTVLYAIESSCQGTVALVSVQRVLAAHQLTLESAIMVLGFVVSPELFATVGLFLPCPFIWLSLTQLSQPVFGP